MFRILSGLALAAVSGAAMAQTPAWQFYEPGNGTLQAFVVAEDGTQLILKCDQPGKRKVFAVVVNNSSLAPPLSDDKFESGPVIFRVDEGAPQTDNWRFNDKFAMAVNQGNVRSLTRLLEQIDEGNTVEVRLKPLGRTETALTFGIAGAREAIDKVYTACKDESPLG